jgi:hypothetical protein
LTNEKIDGSPPEVTLTRPEGYVYVFDTRILPTACGNTIAIGDVTFEGDALDRESGLKNVEFYVDNRVKKTVSFAPFAWTWSERTLGGYTVKMVAHDAAGNIAGTAVTVFVVNL